MRDYLWSREIKPVKSSGEAEQLIRKKSLRSKLTTLALSGIAVVASYYSYKYFSIAISETSTEINTELYKPGNPFTDITIAGLCAAFGVLGTSTAAYLERAYTNDEIDTIVASWKRFKGLGTETLESLESIHSAALNTAVPTRSNSSALNLSTHAPLVAATTPLALEAYQSAPSTITQLSVGLAGIVGISAVGLFANSIEPHARQAIDAVHEVYM